jgi:hypothetical protein
MDSKEAYDAICSAIDSNAGKRLIKKAFLKQHFGDFLIAFEERSEARAIINERGFITVMTGADGDGELLLTVPSFCDIDAQTLLRDLKL